jgi:hypothetical protein
LAIFAAFALDGLAAVAQSPGSSISPKHAGRAVSRPKGYGNDPVAKILTDVPMRGIVFEGLTQTKHSKSRCRAALQGRTADGRKICTHGPDAAPEGVDVRVRPSTDELSATAEGSGTNSVGVSTRSLPCYGDGSSGPRVQAIYARASDVADRSAQIAQYIPQWAANVDAAFNQSAAQTGGIRHVKWVTTPDCSLVVEKVELSPAGDDSLTAMINELKAKGYSRTDRKYLVWTDATRYCGIAEVLNDDQASASNRNNFGPTFGRVDSACWGMGSSTEAHELMHMLGGIQPSAPHASGGWHCTDESDRMCLDDGMGNTLTYACPSTNEPMFDCGNDDYFSTNPAPGSYLATHWNAASSSFLSAAVPDSCQTQGGGTGTTTKKRRRGKRARRTQSAGTSAPCVPS